MMNSDKRHFLVVASASRGARFFVKNALRQGHDVTALCRAQDDAAALRRMTDLLKQTELTPGGQPAADRPGQLTARNLSILDPETYGQLLRANASIDAICCFVGVTKIKDMRNPECSLYSDTISAIAAGMQQSRNVEVYYHGSVGTEGVPGTSKTKWPAHASIFTNLTQRIFPIFYDVTRSENILANAAAEAGFEFVIFRPAALRNAPAKRKYGASFDTTGLDKADLPLRMAHKTISREDAAEEILRVSTLPDTERRQWYGHGVYLVDMKDTYWKARRT
ncbi:MAG: hypothetical protein AAGF11_41970 [Myxococcota bacterium]